MQRRTWARQEGLPRPLGATWLPAERAFNFALYSKHAESVTLLLYAAEDLERPMLRVELDPRVNKSGRIWHCRISHADLGRAMYYGYRVTGPGPTGRYEWHAFDGDKILLDPYATEVFFPPDFDRHAAIGPGSNAGRAPLGVLSREPPRAPVPLASGHESDSVIYELHVRGFTQHESSGVEPARRGTFLALVDKLPYLRELGVTAVELMPVMQFDPASGDYWGYSPLSFFAPHRRYAATGDARAEFRHMVDAFHAAGIEVLMDVVFNHTCELGRRGPTYSFKGIDNSTYYLSTGNAAEPWADFTGTGNTVNCANQMVRSMILDSMRYWTHDMGVDGFRFDLASIFARRKDGSLDPDDPPIFGQISGDPDFANLRLIAEPWDPTGAMEPGRAFPGIMWQQWNGRFRDDVRRLVRGDGGMVPALMRRLYGSDDLFPDDRLHAYHAWQGVNYVTCHDGFTLYDLVAYDDKRNWANGENNQDGPGDDYSWNCGHEGDADVPPEVMVLRRRQAKNFVALLMLANGTPMLRAGDEFLQTQGGNNNPYNQDNETSWLDWRRLELFRDVHRFTRLAIAFRQRHPSIARSRFWRDDVTWYGAATRWPDLSPGSHTLAYCLRGASQDDDDLYVMINAGTEPASFAFHDTGDAGWRRALDTSLPPPHDIEESACEPSIAAPSYELGARAVAAFVRGPLHRASDNSFAGAAGTRSTADVA